MILNDPFSVWIVVKMFQFLWIYGEFALISTNSDWFST